MKLFRRGKDGGPESTVWGYWLCEFKKLFSIAVLCFENGSREAYHDHAFNCISWVLRGRLVENMRDGTINEYRPSLRPVITRRDTFHKVVSEGRTWVLTFRGPWSDVWHEYLPDQDQVIQLTNHRRVVTA